MSAEVARLLKELQQHVTAATGPSVASLVELYSASSEARALKSWVSERVHLDRIRRALGHRDAAALTLADVDVLRAECSELAPATRNRCMVRLSACLRWCVDRGHLPRYPLPRLKAERERNHRETHRTEEQARAIVAACTEPVIAAMLATAYDSGLRRAELVVLRHDQLDHRDGVIALHARETKGQRARVTVLSAWASSLIRAMPRRLGSPWVFTSRRGRPYNPHVLTRAYQRACAAAGIVAAPGERNWLHDLRAGFADQQVAAGTPVPDLMKMAGWQDYRTAQRYLRRQAREIASAAAARINARRGPKKAPVGGNDEFCCTELAHQSTVSTEATKGGPR